MMEVVQWQSYISMSVGQTEQGERQGIAKNKFKHNNPGEVKKTESVRCTMVCVREHGTC